MKTLLHRLRLLSVILVFFNVVSLSAQVQTGDVFALRRQKLMDFFPEGVIVLKASERNQKDFYYLTGLDEPNAAILLSSEGEGEFILFVQPENPMRSLWDGDVLGLEGATKILGTDRAYPLDQFENTLPRFLRGKEKIGCSFLDEELTLALMRMVRRPWNSLPKTFIDLTEFIHEMRLIKSPEEIERIQRAVDITCEAHIEAMKAAEPGMNEAEIEAVIEYVFRSNGASGPGFPSIVGSGPNSTILHYEANNRQTEPGDLVVMDIGAEFQKYMADVTRTMPVSGKFTEEQKELYGIVLHAQEEAIKIIGPGVGIDDIHYRAVSTIADGLFRLGLITEKENRWQMRVWLMYRINHWLGLDVHDVGDYRRRANSSRPLEPGMVLTVEPGVYIREESIDNLEQILGRSVPKERILEFVESVRPAVQKYAGIGIRIEDDILVTEEGCKNLSLRAPKKIEDIERIMKKKSTIKK